MFNLIPNIYNAAMGTIFPEPYNATANIYPCDDPFVKFKVGNFFKKSYTAKADDTY